MFSSWFTICILKKCIKMAFSCLFRYFQEPGVGGWWPWASSPHRAGGQSGPAGQTVAPSDAGPQHAHADGPPPLQRGQHCPTSTPSTSTHKHEIPAAASGLPCPAHHVASAGGCTGTGSASASQPAASSAAGHGGLQPGENEPHCALHATAGRLQRQPGTQPGSRPEQQGQRGLTGTTPGHSIIYLF